MTRVKAGALNQRIRIEAETLTTDPTTGADARTWATWLDNEPAEFVPLSGREFLSAGQRQGETTARVTIRRRAGVLDTMRVVHDGVTYAIRAVLPDPSHRDHLTLMVGGGVSNGE